MHDTNPPTEWHQRPVEQFEPGTEWNGAAWKAIARFRRDHHQWDVSTIDVDWGCTLISRRVHTNAPDSRLELPEALVWDFFDSHRRELLNLMPPSAPELLSLLRSSERSEGT